MFRSGKRKSLRLNKDKISSQVEQALTHDGENWSLLAVIKENDINEEDGYKKLQDIITEFTEENGYTAEAYDGHTVFTRDNMVYYIKPVGHATHGGGFEVWDFHINNNLKELFINEFKTN